MDETIFKNKHFTNFKKLQPQQQKGKNGTHSCRVAARVLKICIQTSKSWNLCQGLILSTKKLFLAFGIDDNLRFWGFTCVTWIPTFHHNLPALYEFSGGLYWKRLVK